MVTMDRSNMILDYSRGWTLSISRGGWWDSSLLTFAEVNLSVSFNPKIPKCWEKYFGKAMEGATFILKLFHIFPAERYYEPSSEKPSIIEESISFKECHMPSKVVKL